MQDNIYSPGEARLDLNPGIKLKQEGYGTFDLGQCFEIAINAFKVHWATALGVTLLGVLIQTLAYLSVYVLIGFWLAPIVFAGFQMIGIEIIRGRLDSGIIFKGFSIKSRAWTSTTLITLIYILPMLPGMLALGIGMGVSAATGGFEQSDPPVAFWIGYIGFIISILIALPLIMYLRGRLILVHPLVFDRGFGGVDAIKESWRVTKEQQWMLMLHIFVAGMVAQAGVALCYIGIFASIPFGAAVIGAAQAQLLGEIEPTMKGNSVPSQSPTAQYTTAPQNEGPSQSDFSSPAPNPYDDNQSSSGTDQSRFRPDPDRFA